MSHSYREEMPDNPGDPANTDPEATSAEQAEEAADRAQRAAAGEAGDPVDPDISAAVEEELADIDAELQGAGQEPADSATAQEAASSTERQLAERTEDLQRITAEYANFRRRTERDRNAVTQSAKAQVVSQLLPIVDDLHLAEQHGDLGGPLKSFSDKLTGVLTGLKVTEFGAEGDAFDPEIHEAVQDLSDGDNKVVGQVLRRGFKLEDRLLRTAMVIIGNGAEN